MSLVFATITSYQPVNAKARCTHRQKRQSPSGDGAGSSMIALVAAALIIVVDAALAISGLGLS